jgi:thioredoxin 1
MKNIISGIHFNKMVLLNQGLNIVIFYAEWNGPSQMMFPVFDNMADVYKGRARFYYVDIDKEPSLKAEYGIMELPTILFFMNGEMVDYITGIISKNDFNAKLENTLIRKI